MGKILYVFELTLVFSFGSLQNIDGQFSHYAHLRTLDLSFNKLECLPRSLPRSLWDIRASGNHLQSLDKNDTAYHWNLRVLDLSNNELERVVFINNTLPSLCSLNLSYNRFWTVPTNMPHNLETIDLSHNYLVQILPGSLDRLPRLTQFYLHANHFSWLPEEIFGKLMGLKVITLGDNPWACEEEEKILQLLNWAERTYAIILGCPCYTRPTCGQAHMATPEREWHLASYTEPPFRADIINIEHDGRPFLQTAEVTSSYQVKSALFESGMYGQEIEDPNGNQRPDINTTVRPHTKKQNVGNSQSVGHRLFVWITTLAMNIVITMTVSLSTLWNHFVVIDCQMNKQLFLRNVKPSSRRKYKGNNVQKIECK